MSHVVIFKAQGRNKTSFLFPLMLQSPLGVQELQRDLFLLIHLKIAVQLGDVVGSNSKGRNLSQ